MVEGGEDDPPGPFGRRAMRTRIALVAAVGLLTAAPVQAAPPPNCYERDGQAKAVEAELRGWKPGPENDHAPRDAIRSQGIDIVGTWRSEPFRGNSSIEIGHPGSGEYGVTFSDGGCLGWWRLHRLGRYANGVLTLNAPVREYGVYTYQRLYMVRVGETDYLVPDARIEQFESNLAADGKWFKDRFSQDYYLHRETPKPPPVVGSDGTFLTEDEVAIRKLTAALLAATPTKQAELIEEYKVAVGVAYTECLAQVLPKLPTEAQKEARRALVDRMRRFSPATLRDKLKDDSAEVRRAAANACANKGDRDLIPDLIAVVVDDDPAVARSAGWALKQLTGQDFGPAASSTAAERARAQASWRDWYAKHK
jgi:hypothetical protein